MKINQAGVDKAKSLIEKNQYTLDSDWSDVQPNADKENDFLERHDWNGYAEWFLAVDTEENEQTKGRYHFPFGDFRRVHRSGVIAVKQRAAQYEYNEVERVADELLSMIDER